MTKPIIADIKPKKVTLNEGEEYHFCVCGRSKNQPFLIFRYEPAPE